MWVFSGSLQLKSAKGFCKITRSAYLTDVDNPLGLQGLSRKGVLLTMARKSKRMALNEAIRQGQAKIAESLKTGQMRSDGPSAQRAEKDKEALSSPGNVMQNPVDKCRALFKSKEKSVIWEQLPPKTKLIALFCVASVVALVLGLWLISLIGTDQPPQVGSSEPQKTPVAGAVSEENEQAKKKFRLPGSSGRDSSDSVGSAASEKASLPPPSGGANVILIQSIAISRKGELGSLEVFFRSKGIQTEIIEISGSNLAALVTQDGFEKNPGAEGTEGYKLLERIKQFGTVYVKETEDTKFGLKPFQDAYGHKR
jgi:hypothetical protein